MLEAFQNTMTENLSVGGEFYVSLAYRHLLANNKPVKVYPVEHFMQWVPLKIWKSMLRQIFSTISPQKNQN